MRVLSNSPGVRAIGDRSRLIRDWAATPKPMEYVFVVKRQFNDSIGLHDSRRSSPAAKGRYRPESNLCVGAEAKLTHGADFRCPTDDLWILLERNVLRRVQEGQWFPASWVNSTSAPTIVLATIKPKSLCHRKITVISTWPGIFFPLKWENVGRSGI